MGVLSSKEKKGLEDVFLSIHTNENRYKTFIVNLPEVAKHGLKKTKKITFSYDFFKKKKNLSK